MSQERKSLEPEREIPNREIESPAQESKRDIESPAQGRREESLEPKIAKRETESPAQEYRGEGYHRDTDELVVIETDTRLSVDQRRTAHQLRLLYQSLCGGQPGQYWPQALLDSAGGFNRPAFPDRHYGKR